MELNVKIKKLDEKSVIPQYAKDGDACLDLVAISEKIVMEHVSGPFVEYGTGLAFEIPKGYVGLIFPRSSITSKTSLMLGNHVGVIDAGYRGEVKFRFRNVSKGVGKKYSIGDRIGQIMIIPYPKINFEVVNELSDTDRGKGGYGSTGD